MKKITLVILAILISGAAFAKHKHKKKKQKTGNIISVTMRRTACYGRCPDYTIEINNDGSAIYTGRRFVTDSGTFIKNIGVAKAMEVIDQFNAYKVDTCKNVYYNRISDLPGLIITVKYTDSTKTIRNAHFGPNYLQQLATAMDEAGKKTDDTWKKVTTPKSN